MQFLFRSDLQFLKNPKKLTLKAHFVVLFQMFLDHALLRPYGDAPIFHQMKSLMDIQNAVKIH